MILLEIVPTLAAPVTGPRPASPIGSEFDLKVYTFVVVSAPHSGTDIFRNSVTTANPASRDFGNVLREHLFTGDLNGHNIIVHRNLHEFTESRRFLVVGLGRRSAAPEALLRSRRTREVLDSRARSI